MGQGVMLLQKVGDPVGQHPGFTTARTGHNEERPPDMGHGFALLLVEPSQKVGVCGGGVLSLLKCKFLHESVCKAFTWMFLIMINGRVVQREMLRVRGMGLWNLWTAGGGGKNQKQLKEER